jgi:hypothetical protein
MARASPVKSIAETQPQLLIGHAEIVGDACPVIHARNHAFFNLHTNDDVIYTRPSNIITNGSRLATLRLSGNFILGRVTYCDLCFVMVDRSKETQMNLAWTFWDVVRLKTAPTRTWRGILLLGDASKTSGDFADPLPFVAAP